jgi:hypothetical protein
MVLAFASLYFRLLTVFDHGFPHWAILVGRLLVGLV